MKISDAIKLVLGLSHPKYPDRTMSKFYIAKSLGVSGTIIDKWLRDESNTIRDDIKEKFLEVYGIEVQDNADIKEN